MLPKLKPYIKKLEYSYTFGAYPTMDLFKYRRSELLKLIFHENGATSDGIAELKTLCEHESVPYEINGHAIEKIAAKENTYVIGIFKKYDAHLANDANHIVLCQPKNMGNIGTIIRCMVGFGYNDLAIIKPAADIFDPKVVRSAMGALFKINFRYFASFDEYNRLFPTHTKYPFMLTAANSIRDISWSAPYSLIQGNESEGLPESFAQIGQPVFIPHRDEIDSLNLSVATSIAMWEASKATE